MRKIIIIAICLVVSSCVTQRELYRIDMSGRGYNQIDLKLSDISIIEYVPIANCDAFSNDDRIYSKYNNNHSITVTDDNIFMLSGVESNLNDQTKKGIYSFDRYGSYVGSVLGDTVKGFSYNTYDLDSKNRICANGEVGCRGFNLFDNMLNQEKSKTNFSLRGNYIYLINDKKVLSFNHKNELYFTNIHGNRSVSKPIYSYNDSRYFFRNLTSASLPIFPYTVKTDKGYLIPSPITDTVKIVDKKGRIYPYIINTNIRFDTTQKIMRSLECKECGRVRDNLFHVDKAMTHMNCSYGDSVLWCMWPTIETNDYIFFTSASKPDAIQNRDADYYVYRKSKGKMYMLSRENIFLKETPLVFDKCFFNHRNLTTTENSAFEFISLKYLRDNQANLPPKLKDAYEKLKDGDSGVLMIIKFI